MDYDTRNTIKENQVNTAWNNLRGFINSEIRYSKFESKKDELGKNIIAESQCYINCQDIAILTVMARYLDMKGNFCCIKQSQFAKEAGIPYSTFRKRCDFLEFNKIIFRTFRGKLYFYHQGELLTGESYD